VGYLFFRLLWHLLRRLTPAAFFATFIGLLLSTFSMIGVIGLGISHYETLIHQDKEGGIFEFKLFNEERHPEENKEKVGVDLKRFMAIVLPLSLIGWILEGVITTLILRYIHRLRPDLLQLEGRIS
jgi:ABC-type Co2+ transport system permease subunit